MFVKNVSPRCDVPPSAWRDKKTKRPQSRVGFYCLSVCQCCEDLNRHQKPRRTDSDSVNSQLAIKKVGANLQEKHQPTKWRTGREEARAAAVTLTTRSDIWWMKRLATESVN